MRKLKFRKKNCSCVSPLMPPVKIPKCLVVKNITRILAHSSIGWKSRHSMAYLVLCPRVPEDWSQRVGWAAFLSRGHRQEFASKLIEDVGRIPFLPIVRLRSHFLCWLSAEGCSQFLETALPPSSKAATVGGVFLTLQVSLTSPLPPLLCFFLPTTQQRYDRHIKGGTYWMYATWWVWG